MYTYRQYRTFSKCFTSCLFRYQGYFDQESLDNYQVAIDITGIPDMYINTYAVSL